MNGNDIMQAMTNISDRYIVECAEQKKPKRYLSPVFYGSLAAAAVIAVGVMLAVPKLADSHTAVVQTTSHAPVRQKDDDSIMMQNDIAKEDIAAATDAAYVPLSVKVYTAQNSEPVALTEEPVTIKGDFNPLLSSSKGLGIELAITSQSRFTLKTDGGHFLSWDSQSGAVTNYGQTYSAAGTTIFWTLSSSSPEWDTPVTITIFDENGSPLSEIHITGDESTHTFTAVLQDAKK